MKLFSYLLVLLSIPTFASTECFEVRAAFDLGSASTTLRVAEVDICKKQVTKVIFEEVRRVDYSEDLFQSKSSEFSSSIIDKGVTVLGELKKIALEKGAKKFTASATEAHRDAKNAEAFIKRVNKELSINARVITQDEEARLGFEGATKVAKASPSQAIVWDVGGRSMQISYLNPSNELQVYRGQLSAVEFKRKIISEIQKKALSTTSTPNPMSPKDFNAAIKLAAHIAGDVPPNFAKAFKGKTVLGLGGVLSRSLYRSTNERTLTPQLIKKTFLRLHREAKVSKTTLDDAFVAKSLGGSKYPDTDISNLAFILGFMKRLGIKQLTVVDAYISDGMLSDDSYFQVATKP